MQEIPLGFTFSFPTRQRGLDSAELVTWTKGFVCDGAVGVDVVRLMQAAIDRRKGEAVRLIQLLQYFPWAGKWAQKIKPAIMGNFLVKPLLGGDLDDQNLPLPVPI